MKATGDTITDEQILSVVDEAGNPPDALSVRCPKCHRGPGWFCVPTKREIGRMIKTHIARRRAAKVAEHAYLARCAEIYNARYGGES